MKSPFPYFGGKSKVASIVWSALGDVRNYVEPFAGSLAVLLSRPHEPKVETVNDMDALLANFWRALRSDPDAVAEHADWPVNEADLEARHYWLVQNRQRIRDGLGAPEWYDAKAAGWWVWGISCWIGGGWCSGEGPHAYDGEKWVSDAGHGINRQRPHLGDAGQGINRKLPHLGNAGQGINRKRPHLSDAGQGINRKLPIYDYFHDLAERLRHVRVCCGDWARVCGPSVTFKHGLTGVFLDPPYANGERSEGLYAHDCGSVAADVTRWALENGKRDDMRIVVAGYDVEHVALTDAGWRPLNWKTNGGYGGGRGGAGDINKHREMLWFSPACIAPQKAQETLFA